MFSALIYYQIMIKVHKTIHITLIIIQKTGRDLRPVFLLFIFVYYFSFESSEAFFAPATETPRVATANIAVDITFRTIGVFIALIFIYISPC